MEDAIGGTHLTGMWVGLFDKYVGIDCDLKITEEVKQYDISPVHMRRSLNLQFLCGEQINICTFSVKHDVT